MTKISELLSGRRSSWFALVIAIAAMAALFALLPKADTSGYPAGQLPDDAESARVAALTASLDTAETTVGIVVYDRGSDALTDADRAAITANASRLAPLSVAPQAVRPQFSDNGTSALVAVPLDATTTNADPDAAATTVREAARSGLPDGLTARLTGQLGFEVDTAQAFAGADIRLLAITAGVVALLLLITYRSPILWLVPLTVIAVADGLARFVIAAIGEAIGQSVDASVSGIASVLVFGAGTNYALLLIARYREELLNRPDQHDAMAHAWRRTAPAIIASGGTVAAALLTLEFASLPSNRLLGWACATGIVIAIAGALLVLPPALAVCGRKLFWPFIPRCTPERPARVSVWQRLALIVRRHPAPIAAGSVALLAVLALGLGGYAQGLSRTDQLISNPESVQAQEVIDRSFAAGLSATATLLAPTAEAEQAAQVATDTQGVASVRPGAANDSWTSYTLTLSGEPASDANRATVERLRDALAASPAADALVGGAEAESVDQLAAAQADQRLIMPLILVIVLLVLLVLLRAILAPLLLIATVLASFAAALGAGTWLFHHVLDYPALDTSVTLFAYLFLVALGVDYNIFLTTRAREERNRLGARDAMVRALASTGGVITSAGILLAAVFAVLGVLPVIALAQIGLIVCIGVLLDTLLVRTVLVPALAFLTGERFWWPSRRRVPSDGPAPSADARVGEGVAGGALRGDAVG